MFFSGKTAERRPSEFRQGTGKLQSLAGKPMSQTEMLPTGVFQFWGDHPKVSNLASNWVCLKTGCTKNQNVFDRIVFPDFFLILHMFCQSPLDDFPMVIPTSNPNCEAQQVGV